MSQEHASINRRNNIRFIGVAVIIAVISIVGGVYYAKSGGRNATVLESDAGVSVVRYDLLTSETSDASFSPSFDPGSVIPISNFEEGDASWKGGAIPEIQDVYQGETSLSFISIDRKEISAFMEKKLDLSSADMIELMLYVSEPDDFETMEIDFSDAHMDKYYRYNFSNVQKGWQLVQIPKRLFIPKTVSSGDKEDGATIAVFDWDTIERVRITLSSRPDAILTVKIDMLRGIVNHNDIVRDWRANRNAEKLFVSAFDHDEDGSLSLLVRNQGTHQVIFSGVKNMRDAIVQARIIPESGGRSGLFVRGNYNSGYGYYFLISGVGSGTWEILKYDRDGWTKLLDGTIGNASFRNGEEYILRVHARGEKLQFSLAFDESGEFINLGKIEDRGFASGGVGLAVRDGGWSIINEVLVKKL